MDYCIRCDKQLTDPDSQRRGYGPTCWEKYLQSIRDDICKRSLHFIYNGSQTVTTTNIGKSCSVKTLINHKLIASKETCPTCNELLSAGGIGSFDSDKGLLVPGFGKPQRFYVKCRDCKHETYISLDPDFVKELPEKVESFTWE